MQFYSLDKQAVSEFSEAACLFSEILKAGIKKAPA